MEAKFSLSFLLEYLRSVAHALFQRKVAKDLDVEITVAKEALARAQKVLQDFKTKKQQALFFLNYFLYPYNSSEGSLLASLMP